MTDGVGILMLEHLCGHEIAYSYKSINDALREADKSERNNQIACFICSYKKALKEWRSNEFSPT
jgi:UDP-N-acetyl-D-mannosaminuronate dehydrogenase